MKERYLFNSLIVIFVAAAIGNSANAQETTAYGTNAGQYNQGASATAIGYNAGQSNQASAAVAVGKNAGQFSQGFSATSFGSGAGYQSQGSFSTAVGTGAGALNQANYNTAVGVAAGSDNQMVYANAFGAYAGQTTQGPYATAIGTFAGQINQGESATAIGTLAGQSNQGYLAIAIGHGAGAFNQGSCSIAIGFNTAAINQSPNSIALNASGGGLNIPNSGFYVDPIRQDTNYQHAVYYNPSTAEITYGMPSTGPQGPQGIQGPAGPQGIQGPAGPQGPTGVFDPMMLTNTDFLIGLASNPVFLNALCSQIQSGSNNYGIVVRQNQTLNFPAIAPITFSNNARVTLSATASSGLTPVTYSTANASVATIVSNNILLIMGAGSTSVTASQAGNPVYYPVSATQPLTVNPITQTISFPAIAAQTLAKTAVLTLSATSSAKLPITYIVANTAVATNRASNSLTLLGVGTTTVTATNAGTQNYTPVGAVQTLIVK